MTHGFTSVRQIVEQGYCVSCGLCSAISNGRAAMGWTAGGNYRPDTSALSDSEEKNILSLCPGINLTGPFDANSPALDPVWGKIGDVSMGWATDPETQHRSSAGGVMTAINRYLLETGQVDFVLQVAAAQDDALHSEPVMIRDPDDLLTGSQSRYAPVAPLKVIYQALDLGERFSVSLKPCDIAGVRNLQRIDGRARDLIFYTQTMFCGTTPARSETEAFFDRRDVDPASLVHMQWRGDGCPGKTKGTLPDGTIVDGPYSELWTGKWQTQFRCKICPDAVGLQADLATGDIWAGGMPTGETPGENAIIPHTDIGLQVYRGAVDAGYLHVVPLDIDAVNDSQPHHVALRRTFGTRVAATTAAGHAAPNYTNLNETALTATLTDAERDATFAGTRERVSKGQADECVDFDGFD